MISPRAVGDARPGGARAPSPRSLRAGFDHFGVKGKPEIIVAGKHDHLASLQLDLSPLLRLHGMVVRIIFQPHLGRIIISRSGDDRFARFGREQGQGHGNCVGLKVSE